MLNLIKKDLIITKSYIIKALAILIFYIFIFNEMDKQGIYIIGIYLIVQILISVSFFLWRNGKRRLYIKIYSS